MPVGHKDAFLFYSSTPGKKFKTKLAFCAIILGENIFICDKLSFSCKEIKLLWIGIH
ncbi:hypothetical protein FAEPRAA2165_01226 [Faecalibacterium duncaniae]|uniref:Uncharacterized protein n=1 Tax=Faecalibacterium duncaniae (strain DSM 17677 / JCM 31915 / A2-165) TaxID=411483 RepID=C7H4L1_FAED2|nr:hypothetical protein FAEPRAA2165_01226 [Faecalibacterium duncaniae]